MKKTWAAIFCLFCLFYIFFHSVVYSQSKQESDWEKLPKMYKLGYIKGFIEGADSWILGILPDILDCTPEMHRIMTLLEKQEGKSKLVMEAHIVLYLRREFDFSFGGANFGQIYDEIEKVYSDPRTRNWPIERVILKTKGRLRDGWTEKDLDEVIAFEMKADQMGKKAKEKRLAPSDKDYLKKKPGVLEKAEKRNKEVLEILLHELLEIEAVYKKN